MRTQVFIDGQNLYRLAMRAYGRVYPYCWPSYDVVKLANALVSRIPGKDLSGSAVLHRRPQPISECRLAWLLEQQA